MATRDDHRYIMFVLPLLVASFLFSQPILALERRNCEFSVRSSNTLYNYTLASPTPKYPHGVLSEDGFYKIAVNETSLWFQLCDQMIFNHDPPRCLDCQDCGGPLRCGMQCSALVANNIGGYFVCRTIGQASNLQISLIDKKSPQIGVNVKMSSSGCSLSVSVFCDTNGVKVPNSLKLLGDCDYVTELTHPSGCPKKISFHGRGWGWFGTLIIIVLCLFGVYLLAGTIYRFFFLDIRSAEAIPNLDLWLSLPQRAKILLGSLVRKLRGQPQESRATYAPMSY